MVGRSVALFALVHFVEHGTKKMSKDEALAIARPRIDFEPTGYQIRFLRRGIPPRGYWVISFYIRKRAGGYARVTVVLVDAASGRSRRCTHDLSQCPERTRTLGKGVATGHCAAPRPLHSLAPGVRVCPGREARS